MSLYTETIELAHRAAQESKALRTLINGDALTLSALTTTEKSNLVAAINELVSAMAGIVAGAVSWSTLEGKPDTFPPTIGTTGTTAMAGNTALLQIGTTGITAAAGNHSHSAASTSAVGFSPQATAPTAGLRSVLAIDNGETARTDKALFDATVPAALGTAAATGSAMTAARRDHVHAKPTPADISALSLAGGTMTGAIVLAEGATIDLDSDLAADEVWDGVVINGIAADDGAWKCFADKVDYALSTNEIALRKNGSAVSATVDLNTNNSGNMVSSTLALGGSSVTGGAFCHLAELIVFPTALSAPNLASVESYLMAKWLP